MIIKSTAEIIKNIIEVEKKKINEFKFKIKHAPTIGKQFENITIDALNYGIPTDLNINVTSGFVKDSENKLSGQIDCMICMGTGDKIPGTNDYIYDLNSVIAVIEIKKSLFSNELKDSYDHLAEVKNLKNQINDSFVVSQLRHVNLTFARMTGVIIKTWEESLNIDNDLFKYIYHGLVTQFFMPLRIVIGYDGFATEKSLRDKYAAFISSKCSSDEIIKGYGPFSFPDLIICGENCLLKLNSEPYMPEIIDGYFEFYGSSSGYNMFILTELILSRISRFSAINFAGENKNEPIRYYLGASIKETKDIKGWEYRYHQINFSSKQINDNNKITLWSPIYVSDDAFVIFNCLLTSNIEMDSELFQAIKNDSPDILHELLDTGCVAIYENTLELTTYKLRCAILPNGKNVIGEDLHGYFTTWVIENINNHK